jgi:hypothetical protein
VTVGAVRSEEPPNSREVKLVRPAVPLGELLRLCAGCVCACRLCVCVTRGVEARERAGDGENARSRETFRAEQGGRSCLAWCVTQQKQDTRGGRAVKQSGVCASGSTMACSGY